jgi:hypothetical protein
VECQVIIKFNDNGINQLLIFTFTPYKKYKLPTLKLTTSYKLLNNMIIYNVTVNIENDVREEWIKWMKEVHIPNVMNTGLFLEYKMARVMIEEESGTTYSIQYTAASMADLDLYLKDHAPKLKQEVAEKYAGKFVAFRTLLEVI